jgi:hypothetical protein
VTSTIATAVPRRRTTLRGTVRSVVTAETPWVHTDAVLGDDTGALVLRFAGRSSVPGLLPGRMLVVDGTPGVIDGDLVMLNPVYSFDGAGSGSGPGSNW